MPKYKYVVKNEQVLNEFMEKLWRHLGRKKGRQFVKSLFKDPDLIRKIKAAEDAADDLYGQPSGVLHRGVGVRHARSGEPWS